MSHSESAAVTRLNSAAMSPEPEARVAELEAVSHH
jgi:hypothetical protein